MEYRKMNRKWLAFPLSAGILIVLGTLAGPTLSKGDDEKSPLGKLMEQVQKQNAVVLKGMRSSVFFAKSQKDVTKSAKELVKLGKEIKPLKDAFKKAKVAEPQKKWDEYVDDFIKTSQNLADVSAKPDATQPNAKAASTKLQKSCNNCHTDFRPDEAGF
jgi:cytochrome c556